MRRLSTCLVALALATAAGSASARPPASRPPPSEPTSEEDKVEAAIRAWSSGDWTRVRMLLEPLVQGDRNLSEPQRNETALRHLADATLQDEATLDAPIRQDLATGYLQRLLDIPDWAPAPDIHSRQFYTLYNALREQRDQAKTRECAGERMACQADLEEQNAKLSRLQNDHTLLLKAFSEQEVEVREKVARNRAVALIPFGVGHFYNGRKALGATFLAAELVFGGAALGLFIARSFNCTRTKGFTFGSLQCQGTGPGEPVVHRRNAEQAMGLFFIGTVALDIILAQVTFRSVLTIKTTRVRRSELDAKKPAAASPGPGKPSSRVRTRDILQVRPHPAFLPGGAGLGVSLRF